MRRAGLAIALALLLVGGATPAQAEWRPRHVLHRLINDVRWRDVRLSPWGALLNDRARAHTLAMRDAGRIFHSSYRPCWYRGENVGVVGGGDGALRRIFRAFMDSKAHRSIILDPLFSRVGIGVAVGGGFVWVTMIFCA